LSSFLAEEHYLRWSYTSILVSDIRQQFGDQLKCLEGRNEASCSVLLELQDFFRRRAEIETEYAKNLEKLNRLFLVRHKMEKVKYVSTRESWPLFSTYNLWKILLNETKTESKNRFVCADLYANHLAPKLSNQVEEMQRITKRVGFCFQ
uniref:FCH domain-containing protein n=1 Tax=Soboliphyme baturini TaxID=241478 RepID=A0A183IUN8_9BILA